MTVGKRAVWSLFFALSLVFASCTGGGSSSSTPNAIASVVQDLTLDPDGLTTVITFNSTGSLAAAVSANFEADDGQTAQTVTVVDDEVTVVWDERVTPAHEVRVANLAGVSAAFEPVTTSDDSVPTFTITDGTQNPGLGGDTIEVTFAGPNVVETLAEDVDTWVLNVGGQPRDLTGSTFALNTATQVLTITLGPDANLHATFTLAAATLTSVADIALATTAINGIATGDVAAPALISAEQNLTEDEFGRVIDFTFDEALDPLLSLGLARYAPPAPGVATDVEQISEDVFRVTFSEPVIPGVDQVTLSGLVDLHGNSFPNGAQAITQPSPVVNAYDTTSAVTVQGLLEDLLVIETTQAFDADDAIDPANWDLVVDGNTITMADQTFEYDLLLKTLTITLDFDMRNGDAFTITGLGVLEVDGQTFSLAQVGAVAGDASDPSVTTVVQNRSVDEDGMTLDLSFSEALDETAAETIGNYTTSGTQNVVSATRLLNPAQVRVVFDAAVIPGDVTLTVDGVEDIAGNAMAAQALIAITSSDTEDPDLVSAELEAVEGVDNDTIVVEFDDQMIESEVETAASWFVESPVGTPVSTVGATIAYDDAQRTATLTFANGFNLQRGDDFEVVLADMRDLGGNTVLGTEITGDVLFETTLPRVHTIYQDSPGELVVRFTEPCDFLDDAGTVYDLKRSGLHFAFPTTATALDDGLGVRLTFGVVVVLATDTLDVFGVTDLAGNPMFPEFAVAVVAEATTQPSLDTGLSVITAITGENNDTIEVQFDRPMSPWQLLDPANYTLDNGGPIDLTSADFTFDGVDLVTIELGLDEDHDIQTGDNYTLGVNNVWSAQGIQRTVADSELIAAVGDSIAASVSANRVQIDPTVADSLVIEFDESVSATAAEIAANYDLGGGNVGITAERIGFRDVRVTFGVAPVALQPIDIVITDLAGNVSGTITTAVAAADAAAPLVAGVAAFIGTGVGFDAVEVSFDEPVESTTALNPSNYIVKSGTTTLSLTGVFMGYDTPSNTVILGLADGQEFDAALALTVTVDNVTDYSGNAMGAPVQVGGPVTGDNVDPGFENAFVNLRADPTGKVIDVLFTEDVSTAFVTNAANWTTSTGTLVTAVESFEPNHVRVTVASALATTATLQLTGLPDIANNTSGAITFNPHEE